LLAKLDPAGRELWSKRFGSDGFDAALAAAADAGGNLLVVGGFTSRTIDFGGPPLLNRAGRDVFAVKLSPSGGYLWSRSFGARPEALALAADASGNLLLAGALAGAADFGGPPFPDAGGAVQTTRAFVVKLAPAGGHLWSKRFGGRLGAAGLAVAVDSTGAVLLGGSFVGSIDLGGGPLPAAENDATIFAAKLDADGRHLWSRSFGRGQARSVAVDRADQVLLAGELGLQADLGNGPVNPRGDLDAFVVRLDRDGQTVWSKVFGDSGDQRARRVAVDPAGSVLITGEFQGSVDFGGGPLSNARGAISGLQDIFLAKLGPDGTTAWSRRFGDAADNQGGTAVTVDGNGDVLLTGWFGGTVDFGGGALATGGRVTPGAMWGSDLAGFIAKFGH
jgi:hypothetical protein